jgi:hypothetical protein
MPLDPDKTKLILDRLSDELEEAARTETRAPGPPGERLRVERQDRKVTVSRFFKLEISVSGEKERVETTLITGEGQRPETRVDPIPGDNSQYRDLARELIQPLRRG